MNNVEVWVMVKSRYGRSEDTFFSRCKDKKGRRAKVGVVIQLKLDLSLAVCQLIPGPEIRTGSEVMH